MTVNERIKQIVEQFFNGNTSAFCRSTGIKQSTMNTILGERQSKPSFDVMCNIISADALNISSDWLITGEGNMTNEEKDNPRISYTEGVPYYNVDFIGGFDLVVNDQTTNPDYLIDFKKYNTATCWCNVTGHSMEPSINHGDIIALKEIPNPEFIPYGEIYAIVTTNDMRTIKMIGPGSKEGYYKLIPINKSPEYGIQEIPASFISRIYQVLGCMKRF